jgi:hypothetical protein
MQNIALSSVRQWTKYSTARVPASISTVCPCCDERVVFTLERQQDDSARLTVTATASCPGCSKPVHFWAVRDEPTPKGDENNPVAIYMYPVSKNYYPNPNFIQNIPPTVQRSFISSIDAFNSKNYVATAVCARRTLEGIFKNLVPEEKRNDVLAKLIEYVKTDIDLSAPLSSLSHAIRDGGNLGAHFDEKKEPSEKLARQMVELLEYLISYLYVLPKEIKKLEESLEKDS